MPRKHQVLALGLVTGLGLLAAVTMLHRPATPPAPEPVEVGLARVRLADVPQTITTIGTVQPLVAATVRAQLSGTLLAYEVEEGQRVTKGQRLARIDSRPYAIALDQARATLARDEAQLANARLDLGRYQRLLAEDSIARQQVSTQEASVRQLAASVAGDRAQVASARLNLGYTTLVAPVSGRVGLRQANVGDLVGPSDAKGVLTVTQEAPIDVSFAVAQGQIERLAGNDQIAVTARDPSDGKVLATGHLVALDNAVDTASGTVMAKARFANEDARLFPNQFVTVTATIGMLQAVAVVPVSAVRHGGDGDFLFVVGTDHLAHMRKIRKGPMRGDEVSVLSGVRAGEKVVATGGDRLDEGTRVTSGDRGVR